MPQIPTTIKSKISRKHQFNLLTPLYTAKTFMLPSKVLQPSFTAPLQCQQLSQTDYISRSRSLHTAWTMKHAGKKPHFLQFLSKVFFWRNNSFVTPKEHFTSKLNHQNFRAQYNEVVLNFRSSNTAHFLHIIADCSRSLTIFS